MTKTLWSLAAVGIVALASTACSTASSGSGAGSSSPSNMSPGNEKAVRFAQCMRNNGVTNFPDPDASGQLTVDAVLNGSSLDPNSPTWKSALSACKDLQPAGFTGHKRSAQQQAAALKFAKCMRDNGINDFPDPSEDGPLIDTNRIPSLAGKVPRSDPGLNAAMQKCRSLVAAAVGK